MTSADSLAEGKNRGLVYLENITHLLSHRSLDELLAEALAFLNHMFRASGGIILYSSTLSMRIVQGEISKQATEQIEKLEDLCRARIERGARQIQLPSSPPVTKHQLPGEQGIVFVVPLLNGDRTVGQIALFTSPQFNLDHYQLQDLSWMAGTLSAIAASVEQLTVTRQRLSQLGLFYQMGQAMTSTFDTNRLFQDTIDLAIAVIDAQEAALMLLDQSRNELEFEVARGSNTLPHTQSIKMGQGIAGWVAQHGEPVLINDLSEDKRFDPRIDGFQQQTVRNLVCVPLQIKSRTIGVLEVFNKGTPSDFDEEDMSVLITLAAQVSIALDNARLYNSLRAERDRILEAQESTRHELARNLHDGPVQLLAAIAMELDYLERIIERKPNQVPKEMESLRKLVRQATQDARLLLFELRPVILETQGLVAALESYVDRLARNGRVAPHLEAGNLTLNLSSSIAGTIFSIIQEAITNIEKHAQAENVWIRVRKQRNELIVSIEDDGKGFNVESVLGSYDQGSSFGLLNMKERAELIDGVLTFESGKMRDHKGTLIQLRMVLPRD